ncbi:pilus assembly protein TadB, partial [Burkholderia pseudomallei]
RVLSAAVKLCALIRPRLPVGPAARLSILHADFISVLWADPAGVLLVGGTIASMAFGSVWMRHLIRIRV